MAELPTSHRPGVTLVELMVALSLFTIILVTSLSFYRQQGSAFTQGNRRMTVMQNLRYGVNTLDQQLRTAGVGVPAEQPVLVFADVDALAFNADYATNLENDFFATYFDPRLEDEAVSALTPTRKITLPHSSYTYPDSAYYLGSTNSPAETIIFYFDPDTSTARDDDYVLFRQVNDQAPQTVARRLLKTDREFFTYYRIVEDADTPISEVPSSYVPGFHHVALHGAPSDTGIVAGVDSVRAIRVTYAATNGLSGSNESVREITRLIRLPNAGMSTQATCGNKPILGSTLSVSGEAPTEATAGHVLLQWARATDEETGEQDVLRYVIWRRLGGSGDWGSPLASVPPGASWYSYRDFSAEADVAYSYALAAQDCTPQYSPMANSVQVSWTGGS